MVLLNAYFSIAFLVVLLQLCQVLPPATDAIKKIAVYLMWNNRQNPMISDAIEKIAAYLVSDNRNNLTEYVIRILLKIHFLIWLPFFLLILYLKNYLEIQHYRRRGFAKLKQEDWHGAIDNFDRVLSLNPKSAEAYLNRGLARAMLGDEQGAIDDFDRAIDRAIHLNPDCAAIAYLNRGSIKYLLEGNDRGAIDDFNRAINLKPNYDTPYLNRGLIKFEQQNRHGAIDDYNRAINLNPNSADAYYSRGLARASLGDKQGASEDCERAIKLNPKIAEDYRNRGNGAKTQLKNK